MIPRNDTQRLAEIVREAGIDENLVRVSPAAASPTKK
jgi:hypothetical protein